MHPFLCGNAIASTNIANLLRALRTDKPIIHTDTSDLFSELCLMCERSCREAERALIVSKSELTKVGIQIFQLYAPRTAPNRVLPAAARRPTSVGF
jgi:hypothetical protein